MMDVTLAQSISDAKTLRIQELMIPATTSTRSLGLEELVQLESLETMEEVLVSICG
jgi:hypothetical protein